MPSAPPFAVRGSDACVEGWAARRLPFEPTGWLLDYRRALQRAIADLDPARGRVLVGQFTSADTRRCDVENVLLYNLGLSTFSHLRLEATLIKRSFARPMPAPDGEVGMLVHHHRYEVAAALPVPAEPSGRIVAHFAPVALRRPCTVERVWNDLRSGGRLMAEGPGCGSRLSLELTIHRPPGHVPAMLGLVKVLVDGVISALHTHDGSALVEVAGRLSRRLGVPIDEVGAMLMDNPVAILGGRRLLWPFRDFVQWNPADDGIVRLSVTTSASPTWQLSGTLVDLDAVPARERSRIGPAGGTPSAVVQLCYGQSPCATLRVS